MEGSMLIISPNGTERLVEIVGEPTLEFFKTGLNNGHIEVVPFFRHVLYKGKVINDCVAFCDEEGKLKRLPYNQTATEQWQSSLQRQGRTLYEKTGEAKDTLVGPIIVVWGDKDFMAAL